MRRSVARNVNRVGEMMKDIVTESRGVKNTVTGLKIKPRKCITRAERYKIKAMY